MKYQALIFILSFAVIQACSPKAKEDAVIKKITVNDPGAACISITNRSGAVSNFAFTLNDKFYPSVKEIRNAITSMQATHSDSLYFYAWKFMCDYTYSYASITKEDWIASPLLYINSIGFGLCGKEAKVLAALWKELGYKSRVWELNGHIVPEVYYGNSWHMLDPAYRVYYLNPERKIAGVKELMENPDLITKPIMIIKDESYITMRYSEDLARLYSSKNDNIKEKDYTNNDPVESFSFMMPPSSVLEFPGIFVDDPLTINHTPVPFYANCRLKVPPSFEGKIRNTLILAGIRGSGTISINNVQYAAGESKLNQMISAQEKFIDVVRIGQHKDTIELIYYINPYFAALRKSNDIRITGSNTGLLDIRTRLLKSNEIMSDMLLNRYFFYGDIRIALLRERKLIKSAGLNDNDTIGSCAEMIFSFKKYCERSNFEKSRTDSCILKLKGALDRLPTGHNTGLLFRTVSGLPQEAVYYDITNAGESRLYDVIFTLTKPQ